jgi:hypothetical protein
MTLNGFDPASDARFRATMEIKQRHTEEQLALLWQHNRKRHDEIEKARDGASKKIETMERKLTTEIEAIKSKINGAIWSFACAAAGAVVILLKPKLGL